jgi:hypothetical protein
MAARAPRNDWPTGYVAFSAGRADVVCVARLADTLRTVVERQSLYEFAARVTDARVLHGRGPAYALALPDLAERVVVRHNRHGGLLAPITGDLFLAPSAAAVELRAAGQLRARGVPTPEVLAFATYAAPGTLKIFCRADVVTNEIADSFDLSVALMSSDAAFRRAALAAAARLVGLLNAARARHEDLNIKNVLLRRAADGTLEPFVLDVDRVRFAPRAGMVDAPNVARFLRSARKWRDRWKARVTDAELETLARSAAHYSRALSTRS